MRQVLEANFHFRKTCSCEWVKEWSYDLIFFLGKKYRLAHFCPKLNKFLIFIRKCGRFRFWIVDWWLFNFLREQFRRHYPIVGRLISTFRCEIWVIEVILMLLHSQYRRFFYVDNLWVIFLIILKKSQL